jgi:Tfp pilus assembly protein PilX
MRLIPTIRNRYISAEHGFSMIVVMGVMAASSLFVAAAFAAANGDLPLTRDSQDRKQAYSAAEAGINFYQYHLNQDPDYWTKCTNVPAPSATENQPVNQAWNGSGADPRRWRKVAGTKNSYTIELLPANGNSACVENNFTTMIDSSTGSFKLRATGKSGANTKLKRSIVASFRRRSFLDFLYFTDFETTDPINYSSAYQSWAQTNCGDKYRAQRDDSCSEIQFADADAINGPFHTNDDILTCGTPTFGRNSADSIEMTGPAPGFKKVGGSCPAGDPTFNGPKRAGVKALTMPPTNTTLQTVAAAGGLVFTGKTIIRFNSGGNMTVWNASASGCSGSSGCNKALPTNGVIYVKNNAGNCGTVQPPSNANYAEGASCGNLYISGTYTSSLTLAAANDIIIAPYNAVPLAAVTPSNPVTGGSGNADLIGSGNSVMGLVANNFVRVFHPCSPEVSPLMKTVRIDAAILSLAHSFAADNHDCGSKLDNLTINGAIAQKYRGAVGTTGNTGFTKNYNYDDRLRYRSPPYFLEPVAASWHVVRSNEQVPPR